RARQLVLALITLLVGHAQCVAFDGHPALVWRREYLFAALRERVADVDLGAILYQQVPLADVVVLVEYVGVRHADVADSVALVQVDHPVDIRDDGFTTRLLPRLEDLLDAGQACRDVTALFSRTTRMEGAQRELRARLANRLCGDDTDRRPDVDQIAPAEVTA